MEFTQEETKRKFNKLNEKITSVERNLFSLKKDIEVIQTTIPIWAIKMKQTCGPQRPFQEQLFND